MAIEIDGWEATSATKRVIVLAQPYDLYLVGRARKAGVEKDGEAPSPFVERVLREFLDMGTNGGKQQALDAMQRVVARRNEGEQLSRRSIRLHGDVNSRLNAFAQETQESASVIVEAALDNVLNGEIEDMRNHLAGARRLELADS